MLFRSKRTFFVNQSGDVLSSKNTQATGSYSGTTKEPAFSAAFINGSSGTLDCKVAANTTALDGEIWVVVN